MKVRISFDFLSRLKDTLYLDCFLGNVRTRHLLQVVHFFQHREQIGIEVWQQHAVDLSADQATIEAHVDNSRYRSRPLHEEIIFLVSEYPYQPLVTCLYILTLVAVHDTASMRCAWLLSLTEDISLHLRGTITYHYRFWQAEGNRWRRLSRSFPAEKGREKGRDCRGLLSFIVHSLVYSLVAGCFFYFSIVPQREIVLE